MKEYVLRNARVVTPTTVMHGHVLVRDGLVADVDEGDIQPTAALECIDCEGDYLLPGFVELHTDSPWANTTTRGASPCWAAVWMP